MKKLFAKLSICVVFAVTIFGFGVITGQASSIESIDELNGFINTVKGTAQIVEMCFADNEIDYSEMIVHAK